MSALYHPERLRCGSVGLLREGQASSRGLYQLAESRGFCLPARPTALLAPGGAPGQAAAGCYARQASADDGAFGPTAIRQSARTVGRLSRWSGLDLRRAQRDARHWLCSASSEIMLTASAAWRRVDLRGIAVVSRFSEQNPSCCHSVPRSSALRGLREFGHRLAFSSKLPKFV